MRRVVSSNVAAKPLAGEHVTDTAQPDGNASMVASTLFIGTNSYSMLRTKAMAAPEADAAVGEGTNTRFQENDGDMRT